MFCSFCSTLFPWVAVPARNLLQLPSRCIHLLHSGVFHGLQGLPASLWCSPQAENEFLLHCVLRGLYRLLAPVAPSPLLMWLTFLSAGLFGFFFSSFFSLLCLLLAVLHCHSFSDTLPHRYHQLHSWVQLLVRGRSDLELAGNGFLQHRDSPLSSTCTWHVN